ncbi:hypothetical protein ABMA28_006411 [Loxostege sticticalis]|uniref:Uncharacterized protein n=1 Tax=Loxostege sticticalis TaxID=481309 RepID=A0ABD0SL48_LOXSC
MKTYICFALLMLVALTFASALPAPDGDAKLDASEVKTPAATEGEGLETDESRWGYGGYGGYGGWGRGYGGWGGHYGGWGGHGYGGWGRGYGGWGRGYGGYGGWGHGWGR